MPRLKLLTEGNLYGILIYPKITFPKEENSHENNGYFKDFTGIPHSNPRFCGNDLEKFPKLTKSFISSKKTALTKAAFFIYKILTFGRISAKFY